mgnify:CR=1 FL=1
MSDYEVDESRSAGDFGETAQGIPSSHEIKTVHRMSGFSCQCLGFNFNIHFSIFLVPSIRLSPMHRLTGVLAIGDEKSKTLAKRKGGAARQRTYELSAQETHP